MEIDPELACIWTKGDLSGSPLYSEVHKLPILHSSVCVCVRHSTNQSLMHVGGKGVCSGFVGFVVVTIQIRFLGSSEY